MTINRRDALLGSLALGLGAVGNVAMAQGTAFPSKPITLIVDFAPGGPADQMARAMSEVLAQRLGQPVIVDNRPGGVSQIAVNVIKQQPADGHTLLLGNSGSMATNEFISRKLSYEAMRDLTPVAPMLVMPIVLWVPASSPFKSWADLIAAAKSRTLTYGSPSAGSAPHILGEMLAANLGATMTHVPYRGSGPGMIDLIAGRIDFMFDGLGAGLPYLRDGKLRGLVSATPQRLALLPDIPTARELGQPTLAISAWFGIVARAGTPAPIVERLNQEVRYAMGQSSVNERFLALGFQQMTMTPQEFNTFVLKERELISAAVRVANISID